MKVIRPGVCGLCGVAVVQPEAPRAGWINGHYYDRRLQPNQMKHTELVLTKVRCMQHKEESDPRHYDVKGNVVEWREGCGH